MSVLIWHLLIGPDPSTPDGQENLKKGGSMEEMMEELQEEVVEMRERLGKGMNAEVDDLFTNMWVNEKQYTYTWKKIPGRSWDD